MYYVIVKWCPRAWCPRASCSKSHRHHLGGINIEIHTEVHTEIWNHCLDAQYHGNGIYIYHHIIPVQSFTSLYYPLKPPPTLPNSYLDFFSTSLHCYSPYNYFLLQRIYWFFKKKHKKWLTCRHVMSLQYFWNYAVLIGNCLVIIGTALKINLAFKVRRYHTTMVL